MRTVQFGLIGYGAWGAHHARAITSAEGARLVAIAAHSEASCERARIERPEAVVYDDYRRMLAEQGLDAVSVVLPSHLHAEVSAAVLDSGRHLLLEKPMALDLDACSDLIERARRRGLVLAIGHELRLSSLWGRVKSLIDEGAIGDPRYALIELWRRPYRLGSDGWRYDPGRVGNWTLEEPIHFFDLARWYFAGAGEAESVFARASGRRDDRPGLHDNFSALLTFPGGRYAAISQTLAAWEHHQTVKLTGTDGALWATWSGAMDRTFEPTFGLKFMRGDQVEEVVNPRPSGEVFELVEEVAAFARAIREGVPPPCTGEDGWWSVAMCLKAEESLRTGLPARFDDRARP
jgi:myo-inositol 2-dehydrogenase/D-chiro-inositol 1-dehydrogenase